MKFEKYLKKLKESEKFKDFKKENPESYLAAGFFVLDFEGEDKHQIDYVFKNKIATFDLDEEELKIEDRRGKKLDKLTEDINIDLEELQEIVKEEMEKNKITDKLRKIIAVIYTSENKPIWNLQCIVGNLGFLNIRINDKDKSVIKFGKHSLMDIMKFKKGTNSHNHN
jgi:hypothetical protein